MTALLSACAGGVPVAEQQMLALGPLGASAVESFEGAAPGELRSLQSPWGCWTAVAGHARVSDAFAVTGEQCLHLVGGAARAVELTLDPDACAGRRPSLLRFRAERWTRRAPFEFRVDARSDGRWSEVEVCNERVVVGRGFRSTVMVELPVGVDALRLQCTSHADGGVLVDDVELAISAPMEIRSVVHEAVTIPLMVGGAASSVARLRVETVGDKQPQELVGLKLRMLGDVDPERLKQLCLRIDPAGAELQAEPGREAAVRCSVPLSPGLNRISVDVEVDAKTPVGGRLGMAVVELQLADGRTLVPDHGAASQRVGVQLRAPGQDACHTCRIPGLVTTRAGTLIAVYDCRYRGSADLPGDIDVGMSRSVDGGRSWQPMRVILDTGDDPAWKHDGVGDPAVLVDTQTGRIWVAALWSHGDRGWHGSGAGRAPDETGQLVLAHSDDDGLSWSRPRSITAEIKDPSWRLLLQGPGSGICMRDGTLVFAAQYRSAADGPHAGKPFATILWSRDHGAHWQLGTGAKVDTTEAQVVQLNDGSLMLNCRDNRGGARSVLTTRDLGVTWTEHPTSRSALPEPVCMASLIRVESRVYGLDATLCFSNPASTTAREDMMLRLSRDDGATWPAALTQLYDERAGYGYSCLTQIDDGTLGVLYEGRGGLRFLRFALDDLLSRSR